MILSLDKTTNRIQSKYLLGFLISLPEHWLNCNGALFKSAFPFTLHALTDLLIDWLYFTCALWHFVWPPFEPPRLLSVLWFSHDKVDGESLDEYFGEYEGESGGNGGWCTLLSDFLIVVMALMRYLMVVGQTLRPVAGRCLQEEWIFRQGPHHRMDYC